MRIGCSLDYQKGICYDFGKYNNEECVIMETKAYLGWVDFYMELADKLLPYKNDRKTLIEKIKASWMNRSEVILWQWMVFIYQAILATMTN